MSKLTVQEITDSYIVVEKSRAQDARKPTVKIVFFSDTEMDRLQKVAEQICQQRVKERTEKKSCRRRKLFL